MDPTDRPAVPGVSPGGNHPAPEAGHEKSDVSISGIVKFGIGLALAAALVHVALWGLFRLFQAREVKRDEPVPPMVAASLRRTPPEPRLEPDPLAPRAAARAREDAMLASYGWVDRSAGIARIPIDRAMELLVEKGLPPSKPMVPVTPGVPAATPAPVPGAGNRKSEIGNR
jgi:hypothetical protein